MGRCSAEPIRCGLLTRPFAETHTDRWNFAPPGRQVKTSAAGSFIHPAYFGSPVAASNWVWSNPMPALTTVGSVANQVRKLKGRVMDHRLSGGKGGRFAQTNIGHRRPRESWMGAIHTPSAPRTSQSCKAFVTVTPHSL